MNDITSRMPGFDTSSELAAFDLASKQVNQYAAQINGMNGHLDKTEDEINSNLKSLYINTKNNLEKSRDLAGFLSERPPILESFDAQENEEEVNVDEFTDSPQIF